MIRVGIIGSENSHAMAFSKIFNLSGKYEDMRVVAVYGEERAASEAIQRECGVELVCDHLEEMIGRIDALMVTSRDGKLHFPYAKPFLEAGLPAFIDKPVTATLADAVKLVEAGKAAHAKWFCSSSLRYVKNAQKARNGAFGPIRGATCWSPEQFEPTQSEFFWYAIHAAEPLFTIMGTGCAEVRCTGTATEDVAVGTWKDGRLGIMRAFNYKRKGCGYGGSIHSEHYGFVDMGTYEGYKPLLVEILKFFRTGVVPVSPEETLEIYAFLEAATQSKAKGGAAVTLAEVLAKARAE